MTVRLPLEEPVPDLVDYLHEAGPALQTSPGFIRV